MVCHENILPFTDEILRVMSKHYDHSVGAEVITIRSCSRAGRASRVREVTAVIVLAALAVALAWFLVAADIRSNLSALRPLSRTRDVPTILIGWPELRDPPIPSEFDRNLGRPEARVRMLGYMMIGSPAASEGKEIDIFILMPGAGRILGAARRNPMAW